MNLKKCDTQFSWSKIYKSLMIAYQPIVCSQCNTSHKIAFSSRIMVSIVIVLPLTIFLFLIPEQLYLSTFATVSSLVIYFALVSSLFPFLVKYNS
ncbi:TIGR04104 family putative zinc finger protein [Psychrobacillus sp. L3]|uniref:TIGR04104 family putative zinc finger protein n=1 Tax=Psychrobacillus sp. L3 TaxID=3236891 RepID=UPI0036F1F4F0